MRYSIFLMKISKPFIRKVRSFVRREGRMTLTQSKAFETLMPRFGLFLTPEGVLDLNEVFQRSNDKILEIGFGDGSSLLKMAKESPDKDFIGIEVYRTGVGNLLAAMEKEQVFNIRIFCADAMDVLKDKIPDNSMSTVQIFFADPWPKKRHHKRRLVQTEFVHLLAKKIKIDGLLHLATDWQDYAEQMMSVIEACSLFQNIAGAGQFTPRPDFRPLTKYEKRGLRLGHPTWDLMFRRVGL
jgi:tRNA (guanine-N7-)-methyltransferase